MFYRVRYNTLTSILTPTSTPTLSTRRLSTQQRFIIYSPTIKIYTYEYIVRKLNIRVSREKMGFRNKKSRASNRSIISCKQSRFFGGDSRSVALKYPVNRIRRSKVSYTTFRDRFVITMKGTKKNIVEDTASITESERHGRHTSKTPHPFSTSFFLTFQERSGGGKKQRPCGDVRSLNRGGGRNRRGRPNSRISSLRKTHGY